MKRNSNSSALLGCIPLMILLTINFTVGGYAFQYCLFTIFGKDVPWYADAIAGTVLGEIVMPGAIVVWIIKLCGVGVPFIS